MKTTLVVGVVAAILVLVGILAIFLSVGKHSVTTTSNTLPPVSLPFTSTTTTQTSSSTTTNQSSTTSTITQPNHIQPNQLYFLNYSNGTYWYVAVFNVNLPNVYEVNFNGDIFTNVYVYHLYGYTEILLPFKHPLSTFAGMAMYVSFGNGNGELLVINNYGYNWTYGNL